jgi:NAD(P)-dependent dehydrogenase (short-subunit alcohol dehydrogenase family)
VDYGLRDRVALVTGAASLIGRATAELFARVDTNLRGTWLAMRNEIRAMTGGGTIVSVASTLGLRGSAFSSPYSASKHGVIGLTRTAALECAAAGIRVNAVCPGAIDTPMMDETFARFRGFREGLIAFLPMGRMGRPDEVAHAIAWLSSQGSSFVTGETLCVEGGLLSR